MSDESDEENATLEQIAQELGDVEVSEGFLDDESRYEEGEEFGYE